MANRCHLKSFLFCSARNSGPELIKLRHTDMEGYVGVLLNIRTFSLMCFVYSHDQFASQSEIIQWRGNHSSELLTTGKTDKKQKYFETNFDIQSTYSIKINFSGESKFKRKQAFQGAYKQITYSRNHYITSPFV